MLKDFRAKKSNYVTKHSFCLFKVTVILDRARRLQQVCGTSSGTLGGSQPLSAVRTCLRVPAEAHRAKRAVVQESRSRPRDTKWVRDLRHSHWNLNEWPTAYCGDVVISSALIMNRQKAVQRTNNTGAWQKGTGKGRNVLMQAAGFLHPPSTCLLSMNF